MTAQLYITYHMFLFNEDLDFYVMIRYMSIDQTEVF